MLRSVNSVPTESGMYQGDVPVGVEGWNAAGSSLGELEELAEYMIAVQAEAVVGYRLT